MGKAPRGRPRRDASRAQPVLTQASTDPSRWPLGLTCPPAGLSSCKRLFNPQTIQPPPAARPSALPIGCSLPSAAPVGRHLHRVWWRTPARPRSHALGPPGPSHGQSRGGMGGTLLARARGTPSHHATPNGVGGGSAARRGEVWGRELCSVLRTAIGLTERNLKGEFEIGSSGGGEVWPTCAQVLRSRADKALHHWVSPAQWWVVEPVST